MKGPPAHALMTLVSITSIALGLVLLVYVASVTGALAAVGAIAARPVSTPSEPVARGALIYQGSCASCHGGATGGSIVDYPPKHNANGHSWQHADCELAETIRTGRAPSTDVVRATPPPSAISMPAFGDRLNAEEIDAVIAYVRTLWAPDQRASQELLTRERCR